MSSADISQANKKSIRFLQFILVTLTLILFSLLIIMKTGISLPARTMKLMNNADNCPLMKVSIVKNMEKCWTEEDGTIELAQYDGIFYNKMNAFTIKQWEISFSIPPRSVIDPNPWNITATLSDGIVHIRQLLQSDITDLNDKEKFYYIKPGSYQTFGLMIHTPRNYDPAYTDLTLTMKPYFYPGHLVVFRMAVAILFTAIIFLFTYIHVTITKINEVQRIRNQTQDFIEQTLKLFANTIEAKDTYTSGHSERVALYAKEITTRLALPKDEQEIVYYAGLLHDVGKIGIPDNVLQNNTKLSDNEYELIKQHSAIGDQIFKDFTYLPGIATIIRHHHERFDGTGYPDHLKGNGIPLFSRIISIADAVDAMTTTRCYRKSLSLEVVREQLKQGAGTQFDPQLVPIMIEMIDDGFVPLRLPESSIEPLEYYHE
ncbi:MAG: HD-GYP domain-containing protein [Treponema sp.]|nr:HD-GYP domain-containing protein [Treponema sp.]